MRILLTFIFSVLLVFAAKAEYFDWSFADQIQHVVVLDSIKQTDTVKITKTDSVKANGVKMPSMPDTLPADTIQPIRKMLIDTIAMKISRRRARPFYVVIPERSPSFLTEDRSYAKAPDMIPIPIETQADLKFEEKWAVEPLPVQFKEKVPVWIYPKFFWQKGIITGFNFSQASFTNWAGGGENNLNLIAFAELYLKKNTLRYVWENTLNTAYGIQSLKGLDQVRKSEDRLEFTSKVGHKTTNTLYTSFLFNFKTQFAKGYNYRNNKPPEKVSNLLAPAYATISMGLDFKPSKHFSMLFAPISGKLTLVMDQELANQGRFGVDPAIRDSLGNITKKGKNTRSQFGMSLNVQLSQNLGKNISYHSKLDLFSAHSKLTAIDVSWDNSLRFRVNNTMSANLSTALIYDEDILIKKDDEKVGKARIQFKEIFSLGMRFDI